MAGTLAPYPSQFFDNDGNPLSAGRIYTYTAGTSTPATTYKDAALSSSNTNPIILDSAGRCVIFLPPASFKFLVKTSADVTLFTLDGIQSTGIAQADVVDPGICTGRMTLTSGTPVTTSDVLAATSVYFTPYGGNKIALYDGSQWNVRSFAELSIALGTDTSAKVYDLFVYDNAGTPTLERLVWTNDTTRATGLALQDGIWSKSGALTRRYLGSYYTTATGQTEDSLAKRYVSNFYNRVPRALRIQESTASWTYTTATVRQANGNTANEVGILSGLGITLLSLTVAGLAANSTGGVAVHVGIGEDVTTTWSTESLLDAVQNNGPANFTIPLHGTLVKRPATGRHRYVWLEYSAATGTTTWYGNGTSGTAWYGTGLMGSIEA